MWPVNTKKAFPSQFCELNSNLKFVKREIFPRYILLYNIFTIFRAQYDITLIMHFSVNIVQFLKIIFFTCQTSKESFFDRPDDNMTWQRALKSQLMYHYHQKFRFYFKERMFAIKYQYLATLNRYNVATQNTAILFFIPISLKFCRFI